MSHYNPKKLNVWSLVATVLNGIAYLLRHWLLLLIAVVLMSPVGPHLRVVYTYIPSLDGSKTMIECAYLGSRGFVSHRIGTDCPVFAIIDSRNHRRISLSEMGREFD